ncbi:hypothetical protein MSM1_07080 [Mycobacterium sp. SM1]|uniref:hypothetical protein n=1 Tax=Mycobacterium sp. SM1 TaxID=2816243 RepID=UPI001BCAAED8|nr:hypothetical protein [Mycobacterium sp. SM1]MBS4728124.1 hypothetical protein [Mycobacterium sp. SM1]
MGEADHDQVVDAHLAAALRSGDAPVRIPRRAAHAARPVTGPVKAIAAATGVGAVATAIVLGTVALSGAPVTVPSAPGTIEHITVSSRAGEIPLSDGQIFGLLDRSPDYGPFTDAPHRVSCLKGLGYPSSARVLGAQPIRINGQPGVVLVLPADRPDQLLVLAVAPRCSAADTALLASALVRRP